MEDYETAVMDIFINACLRGFCYREVANEYFDNPPGKLALLKLICLSKFVPDPPACHCTQQCGR
jgi:hypothetical protein